MPVRGGPRHALRALLWLCWLAWSIAVGGLMGAEVAAQTEPVPTTEEVGARLEGLAARKLPEAEQAAARQALEKTLENLNGAQEKAVQLEALKRQLDEAPAQIQEARSALRRLESSPPRELRVDPGVDLPSLEKDFAERNVRLEEARRALAEANSLILGARIGPERIEAETSAAQARSTAISNALRSGQEGGRELTPERRDQLAAELRLLDVTAELRRTRMAGSGALQDLGQARRDLLLRQIARQEAELGTVQTAINERRREQSEQTVAELSEDLRAGAGRTPPGDLLARETDINRRLSEFLLLTTDRLNDLTQRNLRTRQQLDTLNQTDQTLEEQISVLQGSLLLTRILHQQKQALPRLKVDDRLADQIADLRLYQFEINQHREQLADPAGYAEQLIANEPGGALAASQRSDLLALLVTRAELLERLNGELGRLLNESFSLQLNQRQLQTTADRLAATLEEQMFWVPSNRPLDRAWLAAAPAMLAHQVETTPWAGIAREVGQGLKARPLLTVLAFLLPALVLLRRRRASALLSEMNEEVEQGSDDGPWSSFVALLMTAVQVLPLAMLFALVGLLLQHDARGHNSGLGAALLEMAQALLVFGVATRVLAPRGIAELHFGWSPAGVLFLRRRIRWLGAVVLVLSGVAALAEHQPAGLAADVIGILIVLVCYAMMAWLLGHLLVGGPRERGSGWRLLANLALGALPLLLIGAVCFGYYYTALKLTGRLIDTLYVLFAWRLLQALSVRWLALAARRLERRLERRRNESEAIAALTGSSAPEPQALPGGDLARINQQSARVAQLILLAALVLVLYLVWADLIQVFSYLENLQLYEYASGTGAQMTMTPISLRDVVNAALIAIATVLLARNLPGLLEVLVLSRIELAQGSAYAITTMASYAIGIVGVAATLATLGLQWGQLQWLVAALSVGLGFGLQEIFANFISGLIILFERPVRIGDIVTIGNLSGRVSRIRTRATTITDFDRKEIIVPNKRFVTDQLVNWTLSDTVQRTTVQIGVAYGSDLGQVKALLLEVATGNHRVLTEPGPEVQFKAFGVGRLEHELRFHTLLEDGGAALDEINRGIDDLFRKNGIEFASAQVDVHLRSADGRQLGIGASACTPPPNPIE